MAEERDFFRDARPAGYILFKRNIEIQATVASLTDALRDLEGHDEVPILIDQEGGRVARMRPPEWPAFPSGEAFDQLYQLAPSSAIEAARVNARALGLMLHEVGVNVDCLPMLDVRQPGATDIVGDRALGSEPMQVAALGGRSSTGWPRPGRSASSSICRAMAGRWSTATTSCRWSRPARRSLASTSSRSSGCARRRWG